MPNDNKLVTLEDLAEAYTALYNRDVVTAATQMANGLMSSTDKEKLDGIETGAQVNPGVANDLTTTASGKVLDARQGYELKCLVLDCGTVTSLPKTVSDSSITSDMVALQSILGTPSAQISNWTITTSDGSLTISGSISGSTTVTLYLLHSR